MMKKTYLPLLALLMVVLASCGKMGDLSPDYFTTTPSVLETVGGKVPVTINGRFPEKYFKKNAIVKITPVLKWKDGEAKAETATFQGENIRNNELTIAYKEGGIFVMRRSFDYIPEMAKSELYLYTTVTIGEKTYPLKRIKVADGVIATSELPVAASSNTSYAADKFQRIIKEAQQASILFLIQQAELRNSQLNSDEVVEFNEKVASVAADKKKYRLKNIEVSAYASPDGGVSLNSKLAANREKNTEKYLQKQLKKEGISTDVDTKYTAQDWEGFQELVSKSNIQDKELILRVLSMYSDPEQRETEIKNISSVFKNLADEILPQLRRARLTAHYDVIGRSDEEINEALTKQPQVLSVDEILYAATLTEDDIRKAQIFKTAVTYHPNDARAYNNLGWLAYSIGERKTAENYFRQALEKDSNSPEANSNLALIELANGNVAGAETFLARATGANAMGEVLGNLYLKKGEYDKAVTAFGDAKSNGAALAQLLTRDYNAAKQTLEAVKTPDAYTHYLMAIIGARTNNAMLVRSSMDQVAKLNSRLAQSAANDREFAKYTHEIRVR